MITWVWVIPENKCFHQYNRGDISVDLLVSTTHSRLISYIYRILQQIPFIVFERSSEGVHWEACGLYANVPMCVCVWESVEWRREQGVGWWAKARCLQVQSARKSGIKLSHPHINYSAACIVRVLACHSGRQRTWVRRGNENREKGRKGQRRVDWWRKKIMIWETEWLRLAWKETQGRNEENREKCLLKALWRWEIRAATMSSLGLPRHFHIYMKH